MNCKFIRKTKGAIAVFLTVIMLGMVVFEGVMIDTSRIIAAKTVTSGAGDLALNSALTNYDKVLYEVYGLFASATDEADLDAKINDYFNRTLQGAGIDGSLDDVSNMLNLMVASGSSVSLQGVPGSALSNEDVIEEQILQYMKFRAPVNIGFGFLEKLESFKDFKKQSAAMEAQMTFEEKLESLQDACQKVYDKANDLKDVDESVVINDKANLSQNIVKIQLSIKGFSELKKKFEKIYGKDYIDAPESVNDKKIDKNNWQDKAAYFRGCYDTKYINSFIEFEEAIKSGKTLSGNKFYDTYKFVETQEGVLEYAEDLYEKNKILKNYTDKFTEYVDYTMVNINDIQELYWVLNHYEAWYSEMVVKEDSSISSELEKYKEFNENYKSQISNQKSYMEQVRICKRFSDAVSFCKEKLTEEYNTKLLNPASDGWDKSDKNIKKADDLIKAIDCGSHTDSEEDFCCLARAIAVSEKYKNKWNDKIDELGDSSTKSSMKGTYESEAAGIDSSKYQALLDIAKSEKKFYEDYKKYFENVVIIDFAGEHTIYNTNYSDWDSVSDYYEDNGMDSIFDTKEDYPSTPNPSYKTQIESDSFYEYLKKICAEKEKSKDEDKTEAKNTRDKLFEEGTKSIDVPAGEVASVSSEVWTNANALFEESDCDEASGTSVEKGSKNKETTKNAKKSLKATKNLLSSVEGILSKARDSIYITEYTTGMFSCYTTGVKEASEAGEGGEAPKIYTIAGNDDKYNLLSKDYNRLWRAEQEYVLWGNQDPKTDVNYTMTAIFGIRFALNLLYAFTGDAEIEASTLAWATAIAGWTGFGVPIVQTVLKIALALAESVYDMTILRKGEDLVVYKNSVTWVMKPSNISKKAIETVAKEAEEQAKGVINSAFNYVDKVTTDKIDEVKGSVAETIKSTQESLVGNAVDYVLAPFSNTFVSLVGQVETNTTDALNYVLESTKNNVDTSTTLGQLEKYLLDNYGSTIVSKLSTEITNTKNGVTTEYDKVVNDLKTTLTEKAKGSELVTKLGDELTAKVSDTLQNVNEQTQEVVGETINKSVSEFLNKAQGYGNGSEASVTRGFAITMNYQEYVHMFLILKGLGNNTTYLRRVAQLIQLNMEMRKGNTFSLAKKYTLLQLNAEVQVNTVFFGKLDSFLDNPLNAKDSYTLKYCGLQGY